MTNKMKILIAYDGSDHAEAALAGLQRAGLPAEVEAIVLTVDEQWLPVPTSYWMMETAHASTHPVAEEARALADRAAQCLRELFPSWTVRAEVHSGSPASSILAAIETWQPDLLVIGSRGRTGLVKTLLGSVSQKVLHHAPCSVRVARDVAVPLTDPIRIIVGVDGSTGAAAAVRAVARRDWPAGTEVVLLSVAPPFPLPTRSRTAMPMIQWYQEERIRIQSFAAGLEQELTTIGIKARSALIEGDAKTALLEEAEKMGVECIFVGSTGMSALDRFLLGSVSGAVAERAACSVEVVKGATAADSVAHVVS